MNRFLDETNPAKLLAQLNNERLKTLSIFCLGSAAMIAVVIIALVTK